MKRIKWVVGFSAILVALLVFMMRTHVVMSGRFVGSGVRGPTVKIDNFNFGPAEMKIAAGTTVTWINNDDVPHVVASEDNVFKSKALDTDDRFTFTFAKPGVYNYYCAVHPKMTARIIVE